MPPPSAASESRYDERVHGGGADIFERFAVRDWRAIAALFTVSTFLESLAIGHLTAFTPLFLSDDLHLPESEVATWTGLLSRRHLRRRLPARAVVGRAGRTLLAQADHRAQPCTSKRSRTRCAHSRPT